ncbi:MAG: exodeoxyribonuclease VII small subunit [Lachnospiraceae bacterium]|nr:exodeoxyribonuclease VII small subunit [Lachnospiraceae bacterium]
MAKAKEDFKLEEAFELLEEKIEQLEDEDISLEDSFRIYKEGMELLKKCNDCVDKVEKQILILEEGGE